MFEERMMMRGLDANEVKQRWLELVSNLEIGSKRVRGILVVPRFGGLLHDTVENNFTGHTVSRAKHITQAEDIGDMVGQSAELLRTARDQATRIAEASIGSQAFDAQKADGAFIQETEIQAPIEAAEERVIAPQVFERDMKRKQAAPPPCQFTIWLGPPARGRGDASIPIGPGTAGFVDISGAGLWDTCQSSSLPSCRSLPLPMCSAQLDRQGFAEGFIIDSALPVCLGILRALLRVMVLCAWAFSLVQS